jgi:ribonuclease HI
VDAHSWSDGHWDLGLVLRRDDGHCVGAVTRVRKGNDDATLAEAMGLQEALELTKHYEMRRVIVEMDTNVVVHAVQNKKFPRNQWGKIVQSCAMCLDENKNFLIAWVGRTGNSVAPELAKRVVHEPNKDWVSHFRNCILHHIQKDVVYIVL